MGSGPEEDECRSGADLVLDWPICVGHGDQSREKVRLADEGRANGE